MNRKVPRLTLTALIGHVLSGSILLAALDVQAAVSQSPLSLTVGVPPNLVLTLDDSGSMARAYVPDSIPGGSTSRRYRSAAYNPMYYNPAVTYRIPPRFKLDGTEDTPHSTSFTSARRNGFNSARGTVNLSTSYRATSTYDVTQSSSTDADNPTPEFYLSTSISGVSLSAGATSTTTYSVSGISFKLTRASSGSGCSVTVTYPANYPTIACSRNSSGSTTYNLAISDKRTSTVPAYYYLYDEKMAGCTKSKTDDVCYRLVTVGSSSGIVRADDAAAGTDERQNFANWYSFYRTRSLATISAASLAFAELPASTRLTWQGLTTCTTLDSADQCSGKDNRFREYSLAQRGRLFDWMQNLSFPSGTPLREALDRAGKFMQQPVAWHKFPNGSGNTTANTYACRPSYHILMTDGKWNGGNGSPSGTLRADHGSFTLPDGKSYNGSLRPYADGTKDTLADLAMHYWATDLNSGLDNKIKPYFADTSGTDDQKYWNARNNPASWQHMVNFTVGLGLTSALNQPNLGWDNSLGTFGSPGYVNIVNGSANWPAASDDSDNNVYDLWHAAINSRGEFFSADSPDAIVQAFTDIMSRIAARQSVAAKPAINSGQIVEDDINGTQVTTVSYQTSYSSEDNWAGDLTRSDKVRKFNSTTGVYEDTFAQQWSAKKEMPAATARKIFIPSTTTANKLQDFLWANAGSPTTAGTLAQLLSRDPEKGNAADSNGEKRLNYLRGDRSQEGTAPTALRVRSSVLGDLYSSSPAVVARARYLTTFADQLENSSPKYKNFAIAQESRTPRVYVGGNDGMLHGFNAKDGKEEFAFIPTAVFAKLNKYTGKNYSHEFYVDGSPVVADVYDGSNWRTILVGSLRAGGKSVFALDVTEPGKEKLLWEFDDSKLTGTDAVKMGFSFSKPTIARLNGGKWAVVFGNGYEAANHTNGKAALFVVDAITGNLLSKGNKGLEVSGTNGTANGLSTPKLSDYNADGIAEFAYAGDLQGNLWRFDLHDKGYDFKVAYGGKPMFSAVSSNTAKKPQPITAAPSLVRHPTGMGYLVIIGTGKYFEDTDKDGDKSIAQSVYGIWDARTKTDESTSALNISRSNLVAQKIESESTAQDSAKKTSTARTISDNSIGWFTNGNTGQINKYGWVLDLQSGTTLDGEMVIEDMVPLGRTLFFQSLVPNNDPCGDGATNWSYAINPATGGKTPHHVFDLRLTGSGLGDSIISGRKQEGEGGITLSQEPDGSINLCTGKLCIPVNPDPASIGRQTWRVVEEQP